MTVTLIPSLQCIEYRVKIIGTSQIGFPTDLLSGGKSVSSDILAIMGSSRISADEKSHI